MNEHAPHLKFYWIMLVPLIKFFPYLGQIDKMILYSLPSGLKSILKFPSCSAYRSRFIGLGTVGGRTFNQRHEVKAWNSVKMIGKVTMLKVSLLSENFRA